jgi:hypothetical protein
MQMMQERSLVSSELSSQVDQCDPNTTVLFQPPANVVRKRWDPKTKKNLLIARPATRSEFQSWWGGAVQVAKLRVTQPNP